METAKADTQLCENCKKMVSKANYPLHSVHCHRNIILCRICKEPYPKNEIDAHVDEAHTKIACNKCGREVERQAAEKHEVDECPKRLVKCHLCELDIPDCEMDDHIDYCGSRTERCDTCGQYVMLKFMDIHLSSNHLFLTFNDKPNSPKQTHSRLDLVNDHYSTSVFPRTMTGSRLPTAADSLLNDFEYAHGHAFEDLISDPVMPSQDIAENIERLLHLDDINSAFVSGQPRRPVVIEDDDDDLHLQDFGHFDDRHYRRLDHAVTFPTTNTRVPEIAEHDDRIPCEFCGELFGASLISEHQETCEVPMPRTIPIDDILVEDAIHQPDNITLIPCEYCDKTFHSEFIIEHQSGCDKAPQQPPEFISVDSRPPIRAEQIVPRPTSPQPASQITAQQPISLVDDDMDYINDMFLKEAIENSLMDKNNKRENGVSSLDSYETPTVLSSTSAPRVRNIPITIEPKPSSEMLTSRSDQGKPRGQPRSIVQHLHENGASQERRHTTGTRPKNGTHPGNSQSDDYAPKPPARRHRDQ